MPLGNGDSFLPELRHLKLHDVGGCGANLIRALYRRLTVLCETAIESVTLPTKELDPLDLYEIESMVPWVYNSHR